jgi:hypothetical protein
MASQFIAHTLSLLDGLFYWKWLGLRGVAAYGPAPSGVHFVTEGRLDSFRQTVIVAQHPRDC